MSKETARKIRKAEKAIEKLGLKGILIREEGGAVVLEGRVKTWEEKIRAGWAAGKGGFLGVVNDLKAEGIEEEAFPYPPENDTALEGLKTDVIIIGGGVIGCSLARELSRYSLDVALLEKEEDLALHASGRNDGMIHPGFAAKPGTKKAYYNVRGNHLYTRLTRELDLPFHRPGSMILLKSPLSRVFIPLFFARARKNGVPGVRYLSRSTVARMEPYLTKKQYGAFFMPSAGVLSPYSLTTALAENAASNGVKILLDTTALGFEKEGNRITKVITNHGSLEADLFINAAGIWADKIAEFAGDRFFSLHGRRGVDCILDKKMGKYLQSICARPSITQIKSKTKGGGLVPTVEGNILVGPTAQETPWRERYDTNAEDLEELEKHIRLVEPFSPSAIITYFAGIRACTYDEDFLIRVSPKIENLIHAAGIQSPGLASAPAIAEEVATMGLEILSNKRGFLVGKKENFNPFRRGIVKPLNLSEEERDNLIRKDEAYGRIVCRCEEISEGEIRDALHSPVPVTTLDGVKRRTRAGTGRCHGGFCTPRVVEIMARELSLNPAEITKKGQDSPLFWRTTKECGKGREGE